MTTPVARSFAVMVAAVLFTIVAVVGGLFVIVNVRSLAKGAKDQSKTNGTQLAQIKAIAESNTSILRVVLAVTGCTVEDTAEQCGKRSADNGRAAAAVSIADIDCRIRRALANKPAPAAGEVCVP